MTTNSSWVAIAAVFACGACDASARSDGSGGAASERLSKKYESCAASTQCADGLRCIDRSCSTAKASPIGDWHVANGERWQGQRKPKMAIESFRQAEAQYKADKIEVPPRVYCGLGAALVGARRDPIQAEEAAAKLHRCLVAVPVGSRLYLRAQQQLAILAEVGFDPIHLGSAQIADRYLTKAPEKPPSENLSVEFKADKQSSRSSFKRWKELLATDAIKTALTPCWEKNWEASQKEVMTVTLPLRYSYRLDVNDDFARSTLKVDKYSPPSDKNAAAAHKCVEAALNPIADEFSKGQRSEQSWKAKFTFKVRAES